MHAAIGRLRGKAPPSDDVLDRLVALNPRFHVSWLPPHSDWCGGLWAIYDRRGDHLWRAAGKARLDRYEREAPGKVSAELVYSCESIMDGDHMVSTFDDQQFGSDAMFRSLHEGEEAIRGILDKLEASLQDKEQHIIQSEYATNEQFREAVDSLYPDFRNALVERVVVAQPEVAA